MVARQSASLLAALLLAACAIAPPRGLIDPTRGIDGIACALPDAPLPAALQLVPDAPVPPAAEGAGGAGGICRARVYEAREPIAVHRLWDASRGNDMRHWWTLRPPAGSRADYRHAYAVCESWNALDRAVTCTLKAGARVAIGTGQSAACAQASYPKSPVQQVYVPADPRDGGLPLEDCRARAFP